MRTAMLDIETTNLSADFGRVLCVCIKPYAGRVLTFRQDKYPGRGLWDDGPLVRAVIDALSDYGHVVTYFGRWFDMPYLTTRAFEGKPRIPRPLFHTDCYRTAKKYLKLGSRRLARVQEFLGVDSKKTPITQAHWLKAGAGESPSLAYVAEHCVADVRVLEEVYDMLLPFLPSIPKVLL